MSVVVLFVNQFYKVKFAEVSIGHTVEIIVTGVSPEAEIVAEVGGQGAHGAAGLPVFPGLRSFRLFLFLRL